MRTSSSSARRMASASGFSLPDVRSCSRSCSMTSAGRSGPCRRLGAAKDRMVRVPRDQGPDAPLDRAPIRTWRCRGSPAARSPVRASSRPCRTSAARDASRSARRAAMQKTSGRCRACPGGRGRGRGRPGRDAGCLRLTSNSSASRTTKARVRLSEVLLHLALVPPVVVVVAPEAVEPARGEELPLERERARIGLDRAGRRVLPELLNVAEE